MDFRYFLLRESLIYTAIVLDGKSQRLLLDKVLPLVQEASGWKPLSHHMTINLGPFKPELNNPQILGQQKEMRVTHLGKSNLVAAVRVECDVRTVNDGGLAGKHITLAVNQADGGKPFLSNEIKDWISIPSLTLVGMVQEI